MFFELEEQVILSVDASSKGVGALILKNDRPVAYASIILTPSQQNYAQIEKEMLAVVFGCLYVWVSEVTVESNHKPLEEPLRSRFIKHPSVCKR